MTRMTMAEARKLIGELQVENKRLKSERQKFLDACTAGVMHVRGVEVWIEDMGNQFVRLAKEGHDPRKAIERWIESMSDAFGRFADAGVEHREALNTWIGATVALSGQVLK